MLPPGELHENDVADLAASFQAALVESLADRTGRGIEAFLVSYPQGTALVAAGGVAANMALRAALVQRCAGEGLSFVVPPVALCTDNAIMIAWAGLERLKLGLTDSLDFKARPRWPLDPGAAPARGAGTKA